MTQGFSDVEVGIQWGDEGKGRMIDEMAETGEYQVISRYGGSHNAGHTVSDGKREIVLHFIPSGIFHENIYLYNGSGCAFNPKKGKNELAEVNALGINLLGRWFLSEQMALILPHHLELDKAWGKEIGSTQNGVGPAYADRAIRAMGKQLRHLRLGDAIGDSELARKCIIENYKHTCKSYDLSESLDIEKEADTFLSALEIFRPYVQKDTLWLDGLVRKGYNNLFEGHQASGIDPVKGISPPNTTSCHTVAGYAYVGGDLAVKYHRKVIGVAKLITSRVGNGPFMTEFGGRRSEEYCMEDEGKAHTKEKEFARNDMDAMLRSADEFNMGIGIRMIENEYGASTKRPRRVGAFDTVAVKYMCRLNGVDELCLTKGDSLVNFSKTNLPGIPFTKSYSLDGKEIDYVPATEKECRKIIVEKNYWSKFNEDISSVREFEKLPVQMQNIVKDLESLIGVKITKIGVGPDRNQIVKR